MITRIEPYVHAGQTIRLNNQWMRFALYIARLRYASSRKAGIVDTKFGIQSASQTDYYGVCAEIAFCQL